jgi:sec-independent protein translocase protein TatC
LLSFAKDNLEPVISANKYISFVISIIFASGLSFLLPVLSFILTKLKLINYKLLKRYYRFVIVFILIFSAIITPTTDIFNMLLLAIPIFFLYLISILISFFAKE